MSMLLADPLIHDYLDEIFYQREEFLDVDLFTRNLLFNLDDVLSTLARLGTPVSSHSEI